MKKRFLAFGFILILSTLLLSSCIIFKPEEKPRHVCSFDTETVVTRQDCASDGIILRSCICGQQRTEITPAPGHSFGDWEITKAATCTTLGYENRLCTACGKSETRIIENPGHDYTVSEEVHNDILYNRYTCKSCDESFLLQSGTILPEAGGQTFLSDRESNFSFQIISAEDEEYIREHLHIINAYFDDGSEAEEIDYDLTPLDGGCWLVSASDGYEGGSTYVAKRSGAVIFSQCGFSNLVFSIKTNEKNNASISDGITYLAALEEEEGGYYPYGLDFSDWSGEYFLTLESAGTLSAGDLICVGEAHSGEEFIEGANGTFGRISSITTLNDGRTLLMLTPPKLSEIFSELEIYTKNITKFEKIDETPDPAEQIVNALYSDPDFGNFVSLAYSTAHEYILARGLLPSYDDFAQFVSSIEIDEAESIDPILMHSFDGGYVRAKTAIKGEGVIPVTSDGIEIGAIIIEFSASVSINSLSMKMWMENGKFSDEDMEFCFEVSESDSFAFSFDIATAIDYLGEEKLFRLDSSTEKYHYRGCAMLTESKNEKTLSLEELISLILLETPLSECENCHPITDMKGDLFATDNKNLEYHKTTCKKARDIHSDNLHFTERQCSYLNSLGYSPCSLCHPETVTSRSFEERLVDRINRGDFGDYTEEFKEITGSLDRSNFEISLGEYALSLSGIDKEVLKLSIYFDFHINASQRYEFESNQSFITGFRNTKNGLKIYDGAVKSRLNKNEITSIGEFDIYMGIMRRVDMHLNGFDKTICGSIEARSGSYAKAEGGFVIDGDELILSDPTSLYESGTRLELSGGFTLPTSAIDPHQIKNEETILSYHGKTN